MNNHDEIKEFLATRRARITPEAAGLPSFGGKRRVPGLRREEVAMLAGVSVDYYTRLERGNLSGASDSVLDALARALQLTEAETEHLFALARAENARPRQQRRRATATVKPGVQRVLDAITDAPAIVRNNRMDYLAANQMGRALYSELFTEQTQPANSARFAFLNPRAKQFYDNWDRIATDVVAVLRIEAGRTPYDKGLTDLIGELSTRSEDFRTRWAAHNVQFHRGGTKILHHPVVGDLELTYEGMELLAYPGLTMFVYTAAPNSPSHDGLRVLASWAATQDLRTQAVNAVEAP